MERAALLQPEYRLRPDAGRAYYCRDLCRLVCHAPCEAGEGRCQVCVGGIDGGRGAFSPLCASAEFQKLLRDKEVCRCFCCLSGGPECEKPGCAGACAVLFSCALRLFENDCGGERKEAVRCESHGSALAGERIAEEGEKEGLAADDNV